GGDDLAVLGRDYRLPPAVSRADDDGRMVLAEPVQANHLVILVRYQPQPARSFLHFTPPGIRRICPALRLGSRGRNGPQRCEGKEPGSRCGRGTRTIVRVRSRPRGAREAATLASTGGAHGAATRSGRPGWPGRSGPAEG